MVCFCFFFLKNGYFSNFAYNPLKLLMFSNYKQWEINLNECQVWNKLDIHIGAWMCVCFILRKKWNLISNLQHDKRYKTKSRRVKKIITEEWAHSDAHQVDMIVGLGVAHFQQGLGILLRSSVNISFIFYTCSWSS